MMTSKENFLAALRGEPHDFIADTSAMASAGGARETFENGPAGGGADAFGVIWKPSDSAAGQGCPDATRPLLEDITKWEEAVRFPNLDELDWEAFAARQLKHIDRSRKLLEYQSWNAQFLRITHLMGFENALCAMYEEPEAWKDLAEAITDYKIKLVKKVADHFHPDFFTSFDDVATERGLFMSHSLYQELIKPGHKRLNDAVREYGMLPMIHTCGKCEDIVDDFIDEGSVAWSSAQPSNDISGILARTQGRFCVIGGFDSNGRPGCPDATHEDLTEDVRRCFEEYGKYPNYIFQGFRLLPLDGPVSFLDGIRELYSICRELQGRT